MSPRKPVIGIARDTLSFCIEASKESHPEVFTAHLRGTNTDKLGIDREGSVLTEVILSPKMEERNIFSVLGVGVLPRKSDIVGTVASKPSGETEKDESDYQRMDEMGSRHISIAHPYNEDTWICWDSKGEEVELEVLDVEFEDDSEEDGWWLF